MQTSKCYLFSKNQKKKAMKNLPIWAIISMNAPYLHLYLKTRNALQKNEKLNILLLTSSPTMFGKAT